MNRKQYVYRTDDGRCTKSGTAGRRASSPGQAHESAPSSWRGTSEHTIDGQSPEEDVMKLDSPVIDLDDMEQQDAEDHLSPHDALQLGLKAGLYAPQDVENEWLGR